MSKLTEPMYARITDRLAVALVYLESVAEEVKSFRLDEAIRLLVLELDKHRGCDG